MPPPSFAAAIISERVKTIFIAGLLSLLLPLYSRIKGDKLFSNFNRGRIYQCIKSSPGINYTQLKKELELENGVLCYHLDMMEKEQLVRSANAKNKKLYYLHPHVSGSSFSDAVDAQPQTIRTLFQQEIMKLITQRSGITQKEIVHTLKSNKRVVSYHVNLLLNDGVIKETKEGRNRRYYRNT